MSLAWFQQSDVNTKLQQARARTEKMLRSASLTRINWAYVEFSTRSHHGSVYEYSLRERSTGKTRNAGHVTLNANALAILGVDGTTLEAIPISANDQWLLSYQGRDLGRLACSELPDQDTPKGFMKLLRKVIGSSVLWQVSLVTGQSGEMQIDYPLGSDRTTRRMLRFAELEMPVHLSRSADYDTTLEAQDFRYPKLWNDDYVLPVGTPKCDERVKAAATLLNVFFRCYYELDFSSA